MIKIGKIELGDWQTDSICRHKRLIIRENNRIGVILDRPLGSYVWVSYFTSPLLFCNELYDQRYQDIKQAKREVDRFLIRMDRLSAFV